MDLKQVALNDKHIALGAKMVPFAGYNMPVRYSSDIEEHNTVRNGVGVFDVSHMGEFELKGEKVLDLLQKVTSNDVSKLVDGQVQYSCLPNETGGIIDDLLVYRIKENHYFLVVNASNIQKDWDWIQKYNTEGVEMNNLSDDYALFAVQGPKAVATLQKLSTQDLSAIKYYTFDYVDLGTVKNVMLAGTGYTGSGGFEILVKNEEAEQLWNLIFEAGEEFEIKPIGLGARDTLRLEKGYCLYGNDINDTTSPIEAGLSWITKFSKDFVNAENLKAQKEEGVSKKLVAFKMIDKGIPRQGYNLLNEEGEEIGQVTSGTMSPSLGYGIGLAYVQTDFTKVGIEIFVQVRKRVLKAEVVKLPFV
ncbi:MAG: glycine cleavage system aminomethyltransferase GcvT [Cytophagales bacterium]|nr:glycine cleavage system aminomethyltransferase GcvT [Cytophagales bacterium]